MVKTIKSVLHLLAAYIVNPIIISIVERWYLPKPVAMFFRPTLRCNSRCIMCHMWKTKDSKGELTVDEISEIFSNRLFKKAKLVSLSGGEVALRADLVDISQAILDACPKLRWLSIGTNGLSPKLVLSTIEKLLTIINGRCVLHVQISLDGVGDVHDQMRGVRGCYDKVLSVIQGVKALQIEHKNLTFDLNCVIHPVNVEHIDDLFQVAEKLGCKIKGCFPVAVMDYFQNAPASEGCEFTKEQLTLVKSLLNKQAKLSFASGDFAKGFWFLDRINMFDGEKRKRSCAFMQRSTIFLDFDGEIPPCINSGGATFGNALQQQADEVWFSHNSQKLREYIKTEVCPSCTTDCANGVLSFTESLKTIKYLPSVVSQKLNTFIKNYLTTTN